MSRSRQFSIASEIASLVISWNTMRFTGTVGLSTSRRCHEIASPSRSSSVARVELARALQRRLQLGDDVLLVVGDDVDRPEVVVDIDAESPDRRLGDALRRLLRTLGQVTDVADAGLDRELVAAEEAGDGVGLGLRLHDDERFGHVTVLRVGRGRTGSADAVVDEPTSVVGR